MQRERIAWQSVAVAQRNASHDPGQYDLRTNQAAVGQSQICHRREFEFRAAVADHLVF